MPKISTILAVMCLLFVASYTVGFLDIPFNNTWEDALFHLAGGIFATMLVASYYSSEFNKLSQPFRFFSLLGLIALIGVFWEFHEYILSGITNMLFIGDLNDTIRDLLMDVIGGSLVGLYLVWHGSHSWQSGNTQ